MCPVQPGEGQAEARVSKELQLRPGQGPAIDTIVTRVRAGEHYTAIVLPTRYGKTHVMRISSMLLWDEGVVGPSLYLAPTGLLKKQSLKLDRWDQAKALSGIGQTRDPRGVLARPLPRVIKTLNWRPNGEMWIAATIQMLLQYTDTFVVWCEHEKRETGVPVLVHIDECHQGIAEDLEWGKSVARLVHEGGARVVLHTATARRSDKKKIIGFEMEEIEIGPRISTRSRKDPETGQTRVQKWDDMEVQLQLVPHHETTFQEAWAEDDSPLCALNRVPFDVELAEWKGEEKTTVLLSDLPKQAADRRLREAVTSPRAIRRAVAMAIEELDIRRVDEPTAAIIGFCCSDKDEGESGKVVNGHLKAVQREFKRQRPSLKVVIATSADDEESGSGAAVVEAFESGEGDVLLTKQFCGAGFDCDRLKVELDLSPVRAANAEIQRWTRVATPLGRLQTATVIMPDDAHGREDWGAFIQDAGGETALRPRQLLDEYEVEPEPAEQSFFTVEDIAGSPFEDTRQNWSEKDALPRVMQILRAFPAIVNDYTHPEIEKRTRDWAFIADAEAVVDAVQNPEIEAEILRLEINDMARRITNRLVRYDRHNPTPWQQQIAVLFRSAKRRAVIDPDVELQDILDLEQLRRLKRDLASLAGRMSRSEAQPEEIPQWADS
jgi:hypothetical protein